MTIRHPLLLTIGFLNCLIAFPARGAEIDPELAGKAFAVFKKHCSKCHGVNFEVEGFDVLNHKLLVDPENHYIVPGKPEQSEIWKRVGVKGSMPPKKIAERPSQEEKDLLKKWIEAGAPPFPRTGDKTARSYKSEKDNLSWIRYHLVNTPEADRKYKRYFTLSHLYDNPGISERDLRITRAALSKLALSLSWENEMVLPKAVDKEETVLAVDLRDLGWDKHELWQELLKSYPYGLDHDADRDEGLRDLFKEVVRTTGCDVPYVRADWFVNSASRPELYHVMLHLPNNARELERSLKVDVTENFLRDKLARGGFPNSNISSQNRMVERHRSVYGAYWKSYDFKPKNDKSNLMTYPLGPTFKENEFSRHAFTQDGGEIIFNLPNGLQGYLLIDKESKRINEGPTDVVGDSSKVSGSTAIVNGLSCMACHNVGMKPFKDAVRGGTSVEGQARLKVERLYPEQAKLDELLKEDQERFLKAVDRATAGFLKVGDDKDADLRKFDEPIRSTADQYQKDLGLEEAACELDIKDPNELRTILKTNAPLRALGLGPLAEGKTIKREEWEKSKGRSVFQSAAQKLGKGTPVVPTGR